MVGVSKFNLRDATRQIQEYSKEIDKPVQVWGLCANNYPFALSGATDFAEALTFNGQVRDFTADYRGSKGLGKGGGVCLVEMSDDCFAHQHLTGAEAMIKKGRILEDIAYSGREAQVIVCAMGTGAKFSYEHCKQEGEGFFDRTKQAQDYWFKSLFQGWGLWGAQLAQVYTGKRPAVFRKKETFSEQVRLGSLVNYVRNFSPVIAGELEGIRLGGLDQDLEITGAEALNLALVYALNRQTPKMTILSEQMQVLGMNPNTPEELKRNNEIMAANFSFFGDMLDNGHVAIRGTRTTNDPEAYNIKSFIAACNGPLVFVHHNGMYKNGKKPATKGTLELDSLASLGKIPTNSFSNPQLDMPHPELICDVNTAVLGLRDNPDVSMVILSPEPACDANTDLEMLAHDVANASLITAQRIIESGLIESRVLPMTFVEPGHREQVDRIIKRCLVN